MAEITRWKYKMEFRFRCYSELYSHRLLFIFGSTTLLYLFIFVSTTLTLYKCPQHFFIFRYLAAGCYCAWIMYTFWWPIMPFLDAIGKQADAAVRSELRGRSGAARHLRPRSDQWKWVECGAITFSFSCALHAPSWTRYNKHCIPSISRSAKFHLFHSIMPARVDPAAVTPSACRKQIPY